MRPRDICAPPFFASLSSQELLLIFWSWSDLSITTYMPVSAEQKAHRESLIVGEAIQLPFTNKVTASCPPDGFGHCLSVRLCDTGALCDSTSVAVRRPLSRPAVGPGTASPKGRRRRSRGLLQAENCRPNFSRPTSPGRALGSGAAGAAGRRVEVESLAEAGLADILVSPDVLDLFQDASPCQTST